MFNKGIFRLLALYCNIIILVKLGCLQQCYHSLCCITGAGVGSDASDESVLSSSTDLQLRSASSSSTAGSTVHRSRPGSRDKAAVSEEELSSSLSVLSLVEECSHQEEAQFDGSRGDGGTGKDSGHQRSEQCSRPCYNLRGKGTPLTVISEGAEEQVSDSEVSDWTVGDVFGGLDNDSSQKSKKCTPSSNQYK